MLYESDDYGFHLGLLRVISLLLRWSNSDFISHATGSFALLRGNLPRLTGTASDNESDDSVELSLRIGADAMRVCINSFY